MDPERRIRIALLPGLHGTDGLFRFFAELCPPEYELVPLSYPTHEPQSYESLVDVVLRKLDGNQSRLILLGESFSGPLALFVANRKPKGLAGVILVASFVLPPAPMFAKWLPWEVVFQFTKLYYTLRVLVSRKHADLVREVSKEVQKVSPSVLANRIRSTLTVDATSALRECTVPILYLSATRDIIVHKRSLKAILTIRNDVVVRKINAPHFMMPSAPIEIWSAIVKFVQEYCAG